MATASPVTIAPSLHPKLGYDPLRDLAPVIGMVETPMALIASNALPAKSVTELIAAAKAKPAQLNYASVGNGSISHLTMELFKAQTGINAVHIPYKGAAPAFLDVISGQVSLMFITTASAQPYTSGGKVRALAVAGILTTAGTAKTTIDRLYRETQAVLQIPEVQTRLAQLGSDIAVRSPQDFGALLKADHARWAKVIKAANIKLD